MNEIIIVNKQLKKIIAEYHGIFGLQVLKMGIKITKATRKNNKQQRLTEVEQ